MRPASGNPFAATLPPGRARALPPATIVAGSLVAAWPAVASGPVLPPFGLLMLLAWRLLAPGSLRIWAAAPLGLADDLVSGQPLGSAVLLWSLVMLGIDLVDRQFVFRSFRQDWLIAGPAVALVLVAGRLIATPVGAHVDPVLGAQIVASILLFPAAARLCGWIDRRRGHA